MSTSTFFSVMKLLSFLSIAIPALCSDIATDLTEGPISFMQLMATPSQAAMPSVTDTDALKAMTKYRQQHRRTVSGHLCAAAFVRDNQIYTDCTTSKNPDSGVGREWCYVEHQLMSRVKGGWDFCAPVIDYDKVRARAREAFVSKADVVRRTIQKLELESQRVQSEIQVFDMVCGAEHAAIGEQLSKIEKLVANSKRSLVQIQSLSKKIEDSKLDLAAGNATLTMSLREGKESPFNCANVGGYQVERSPDGLLGRYWDNPIFKGASKLERIDPQINFDFNSKDPAPGIAHPSYGVRWDGFLLVPETGVYRFEMEVDCGARVFIDGEIVFSMGLPSIPSPTDSQIPALSATALGKLRKHEEKRIGLSAGAVVSIRVEAIHSNHIKYQDADVAYFRLYWERNGIKEVIPQDYMYSEKP